MFGHEVWPTLERFEVGNREFQFQSQTSQLQLCLEHANPTSFSANYKGVLLNINLNSFELFGFMNMPWVLVV